MTQTTMSLGDRMKAYEAVAASVLPPRMPVILRVDGKAFHTYTRGCRKPFDRNLNAAMDMVAVVLCDMIQGAQFAYVQSDEASVLIHGYKRHSSQAWFDNKPMKMCSVAAARAAVTMTRESVNVFGHEKDALFDARVFVLPEADVGNYFLWRHQDAERNTVQMLARHLFGHRAIMNKNVKEMRTMCAEAGQAWSQHPPGDISGRIVDRQPHEVKDSRTGELHVRDRWTTTHARDVEWQSYVRPHLAVEE